MARELAAKQLALFAENPRRYFLRPVNQRVDSVDDDIPPADGGRCWLGMGGVGGLLLAVASQAVAGPLQLVPDTLGWLGLGIGLLAALVCFAGNYRLAHQPLRGEAEQIGRAHV